MGKEEKIQEILDSWKGEGRLSEDSWVNVSLVLEHYGFSCERKTEWVCTHPKLTELARNPDSRELLQYAKLGPSGQFSIAETHGRRKKSGMVLRCYLNIILHTIELLDIIS